MPFKLVLMPPRPDEEREWAERIREELPRVELAVASTDEEARAAIVDADAAYGQVPLDALQAATKLRWLQSWAIAPPPGYYYPELVDHPVVVTNPRGIFNDYIAAHIVMLVLALSRGLPYYSQLQARHEWRPLPWGSLVHLPETTALMVGVGEIGAEASRLLAEFGLRVVGVDARRRETPPGVAEMHPAEALDELLPTVDWVILTIPQTPETRGLIDARRIGLMKDSAFLINIGRGGTIRIDAVNEALRAGTLAGAGLDVLEREPLPADHPLWDAPNVIITQHTAGLGSEIGERRLQVLLENCRRFEAGEELMNIVDKKRWF